MWAMYRRWDSHYVVAGIKPPARAVVVVKPLETVWVAVILMWGSARMEVLMHWVAGVALFPAALGAVVAPNRDGRVIGEPNEYLDSHL